MGEFSFPVNEKLKSRKSIDRLFECGYSEYCYPVRMLWMQEKHADKGLKAGFTVPKKLFRKAVSRNLLKRKMREAFRLNKNEYLDFLKNQDIGLSLFFIYSTKAEADYEKIEQGIKKCLASLKK